MQKILSVILLVFLMALPAAAQERVWLQVEAQPTLREAQQRARAYADAFPDVSGFQLDTGWYAIVLGPYRPDAASIRLGTLKAQRRVPGDAYVSDGTNFERRFWPVGAAGMAAVQPLPQSKPDPAPSAGEALPSLMPQETPAEARRGERALTRDDREEVQQALQWEGFYDGAIDAAFGPGTRSAMRSYQSAKGYDPTGILTTRQRAALLKSYREALADLGMQMVDNARAGIRIRLPMGMVEFARDDPPFVQYDSTTDHGVRVLLISQKGDQTTLFGLYDVMQTLEIVPMEGRRNRDSDSFVLTGRNATLHSYTYARLVNGTVKGFTLAWKPRDEDLMQRAVQIMRDTFDPYGNGALDETLGATTEDQNIDLMSGLEIRRPEISRSGFYVDGAGTVLTTSQVLEQCKRLTIGDDFEADVAARDDALGLAVLRPRQSLTPIAYAAFQTGAPRLQSDVAVAGFSYGDVLDLPVLTYGKLAQLKGLQGETDVSRLALDALPGDAGGPVFDRTGAVMGVLLPREDGNRKLPEDVSFAASIPAIAEFLSANAVKMAASDRTGAMDPEDLTKLAADMTVRVSCWN